MKILFISSGNTKQGISPIIKNQGKSLKEFGVDLSYYTIKGKGLKGYLSNISKLRNYIINNNFDVIHAHYSLSAFIASISGAKPLIVSLMGSDVKAKSWFKLFIFIFYKLFWTTTIVKSEDMKKSLGFKKVEVIPNGVNINIFKPLKRNQCKVDLGWSKNKTHILFAANPNRYEKNSPLAKEAINNLEDSNIELHFLENINKNIIPTYLNSADVILLTSLWEGSPNVIKEAMACNKPIVSTDVGDVKWLLGDKSGHFITTFKPEDVAVKIKQALEFLKNHRETKGRHRIIELGLDAETIATKIIEIYKKAIFL